MKLPKTIKEYREPFVGGGALFFHMERKGSWINDVDRNVVNVYRTVSDPHTNTELRKALIAAKDPTTEELRDMAKQLQAYAEAPEEKDYYPEVEMSRMFFTAMRFSARGRIYGGTIGHEHWVGSPRNQKQFSRYDLANNIRKAHTYLKSAKITLGDFLPVVTAPGKGVFLFLDPPYYEMKEGMNYTDTDGIHSRLCVALRETKHQFLLTYEDHPTIRELYAWANVEVIETSYNSRAKDKDVKELFIYNY